MAGAGVPRPASLRNLSCDECHPSNTPKSGQTANACTTCHGQDMGLAGQESDSFSPWAPGYVEALHGKCICCHEKEGPARGKAQMAECRTCHEAGEPDQHAPSTRPGTASR